jgi:cell division protein FtsN
MGITLKDRTNYSQFLIISIAFLIGMPAAIAQAPNPQLERQIDSERSDDIPADNIPSTPSPEIENQLSAPDENQPSDIYILEELSDETEGNSAEELDAEFDPNLNIESDEPAEPETMIWGQPDDAPYVVAIPARRDDLLYQVQEIVPTAFLTDSRRGTYVQAGAFPMRSQAQALSRELRDQGFDARVVYLPVR